MHGTKEYTLWPSWLWVESQCSRIIPLSSLWKLKFIWIFSCCISNGVFPDERREIKSGMNDWNYENLNYKITSFSSLWKEPKFFLSLILILIFLLCVVWQMTGGWSQLTGSSSYFRLNIGWNFKYELLSYSPHCSRYLIRHFLRRYVDVI